MPKKLLLADDSITIQKVVELTFSDGDYEVIAVNNGAKAIAKLSEIRPDIILSDIIMPEKNGYEVCEYVKSHPDFRSIPVVLLTGTFEPFDPDRADKAGCDAVVTKPFESQSLIQKVEELIAGSQPAAAPAAAPAPPAEEAASPWDDAAAAAPAATSDAFGSGATTHDSDIFGAAPEPPQQSAADTPFETAPEEAFSGETRAFTRMSFEDMQRMAAEAAPAPPAAPEPPPAPAAEPAPWDEPQAYAGETRAFQRMSFDELQQQAAAAAPAEGSTPWAEEAAPPPEAPSTPLFDFAPSPAPEPSSPFESPAASPFDSPAGMADETRQMSREDLGDFNTPPASSEPPAAEPSPWEEQPEYAGETRAIPRMSFEELQRMASAPAPEPEPEPEPVRSDSSFFEAPAAAPSWSEPSQTPSDQQPGIGAEAPFGVASEDESAFGGRDAAAESQQERGTEATPAMTSEPAQTPAAATAAAGDLTDEQIERIARRVVQMLSGDVLRNIAWEVIPDVAEMVVKERIRQLETEA